MWTTFQLEIIQNSSESAEYKKLVTINLNQLNLIKYNWSILVFNKPDIKGWFIK